MKTAINMTMRAFIVKIAKNNKTIAEYIYDALGRRIRKIAGADTGLYYYNNNNQVSEVGEVWMSIGISYQKIIGILNIIAKYCDWKAIKFIPSDELSCVLMDHDLEMGVVTATMEIEDLYPHVELGQLFEDINSKSNLLDLIRFILDKSNE